MQKFSFKVIGIILGLAMVGGLMVFAQKANAIDSQTLATKYQVTFPISELGNCADYSACKNFCQDPVNASACIDFAKKKGFYEEEPTAKLTAVVATAKNELGCDSFESCQNFCEVPANHDRCASFAQKTGLAGGYGADISEKNILDKAKTALGCSSPDQCKGFCEKAENKDKCNSFAKETGLNGGSHFVGPGGCTSEDSCRTFCSDPNNFQVCRGFGSVAGANEFKGPGGCNSEASCRSYCSASPQDCPGFNANGRSNMSPVEVCNRTPNCSWKGNSCSCGQYGETDQSVIPAVSGGPVPTADPAASCARYGCSWNNNSCQCTANNIKPAVSGPTSGGVAGCQVPTDPNFCGAGKHYNYSSCACDNNTSSGCSSRWSCPSGMTWNDSSCDCRTPSGDAKPPAGSTWSGGSSAGSSCQGPSSGCGANRYWDFAACTCRDNGSYSGGTYSGSNSAPTGMSRDSQEATCKAGGGTCTWNGDTCNCQGYHSPSSGGTTTPTPSPTPSPAPSSAPSGMSRDSQQAGCNSCGGTCSWNGDMCNCQCHQSNPSPSPTPAPAPSPTPSTDPATACGQASGCSWTGSTCQCGSVNGISRERSWWEVFLDPILKILGRE